MPDGTGWLTLAISFVGYLFTLALLRWVLLMKKEQPTSTVAWVMAIILIPYLGGLLFLMFGINRVDRRARLKLAADRAIERQLPALNLYQILPEELPHDLPRTLMRLASRTSRTSPTGGNDICSSRIQTRS